MQSNLNMLPGLAGKVTYEEQNGRVLDYPMQDVVPLSNDFASIDILPVELLIEVFFQLRRGAGFNGDLVAASHVCQRWRDVAIRTPELWTQIKLDHVPSAAAFLERSQRLPVSLFLGVHPGDILPDVTYALQPHLDRVRSFAAECAATVDMLTFQAIFDRPVSLRKLSLYLAEDAVDTAIHVHRAIDSFPIVRQELFPDVHELTITNSPSIAINNFSRLAVLNLDGTLPAVGSILEALSTCPSLEKLNLVGSPLLDPDEDLTTVAHVVDLPRLESMYLRLDSADLNFAFLANFVLPDWCAVDIDMDLDEEDSFVGTPDVTCLRGLQRFEVAWGTKSELRIRGWKDPQAAVPTLKLNIMGVRKFATPLLLDWPVDVSGVRVLALDLGGHEPDELFDGLSRFPSLEALRVTRPAEFGLYFLCHSLQNVARVQLGDDDGDGQGVREAQLVLTHCPRLSSVDFGQFDWSPRLKEMVVPVVKHRRALAGPSFLLTLFDVRVRGEPEGESDCMYHARFGGGTHGDVVEWVTEEGA
ncbi:hypothetical protein BN946_scf185004.g18 [Trametes cinnabarina]|uniref:F-box domain-containing protein n=1 Tax=Pycnoporus cinnabarinus TaxID=5643 RepID=A0A060SR12_PYCCI|nr:hypothetical protein BN946_scf185004.g18 [Trametes cinnabarina]